MRRLPGGGSELTDTTAAAVWRFDAGGRLLEQRKRTRERDFTKEYVDAAGTRGQIARVVDAVGGAYVLGYAGNKLETIADPQGRLTRFVVDGSGDLVSMVEPDGETHRFTYDGHRMVTKTSPRGDVTTYGYDANGVIATSSKPGGENYAFEAALSSPPSYDASGATVRTGAVTDARGVRRAFRTDIFGRLGWRQTLRTMKRRRASLPFNRATTTVPETTRWTRQPGSSESHGSGSRRSGPRRKPAPSKPSAVIVASFSCQRQTVFSRSNGSGSGA